MQQNVIIKVTNLCLLMAFLGNQLARKGHLMFFFFFDDKIEDNIIIYNTDDGKANVKLYANDGTVWATQKAMAELFDCSPDNISLHLKKITGRMS